jgi:hypothetical protein
MPQSRLVETKEGRRVWVQISDGDILRAIGHLPYRWPEFVRRRYSGEPYESLYKSQRRLSPDEFRKALAMAFAAVEQELYWLAEQRAQSRMRFQPVNPNAVNNRLAPPLSLEDVL